MRVNLTPCVIGVSTGVQRDALLPRKMLKSRFSEMLFPALKIELLNIKETIYQVITKSSDLTNKNFKKKIKLTLATEKIQFNRCCTHTKIRMKGGDVAPISKYVAINQPQSSLNLFSPNSDKHLNSLYSITTLSNAQVTRIKKMITND